MRKRLPCAALPALILVALLAPVSGPAAGATVAVTVPSQPVAPWAAELGARPFAEVDADAPEPAGSWAMPSRVGGAPAPVVAARWVTCGRSVAPRRVRRFLTPPSRAPPVLS